MNFVCPVCGYVYDEAQEKESFSKPVGDLAVSHLQGRQKPVYPPGRGEPCR